MNLNTFLRLVFVFQSMFREYSSMLIFVSIFIPTILKIGYFTTLFATKRQKILPLNFHGSWVKHWGVYDWNIFRQMSFRSRK